MQARRVRQGPPPQGSRVLGCGAEDGCDSRYWANGDRVPSRVVVMPVRVVIVDDHDAVRSGLRDLLRDESDIDVVGEAASFAEAREVVPSCDADVVVLDVRPPDGSCVELCRELRSADPSLSCLLLTSFDDDRALLSVIVAGASGYVLKQLTGVDIAGAIRDASRGSSTFTLAVRTAVVERLGHRTGTTLAGLSSQEHVLLGLLVEGKTNRQIGADMHGTERTVHHGVSNLLTKLGMDGG
jgi:two-component system, NarL family, response regulator DevR